MQKNEIVRVTIEDIGMNGEGIGRVNGYTLFIKDTIIGDEVEAKILKAKKSYGYARLLKILTPSAGQDLAILYICQKMQWMSDPGDGIIRVSWSIGTEGRGNLERIGGFAKDMLDQVMEPIVGWNRRQMPMQGKRRERKGSRFWRLDTE